MKLRAKKGEGAATLDEIAEFSRGLICITRHPDERMLDIFGKRHLYAELQRHSIREEEAENQAIMDRARQLDIPLVATNGVAYAMPAQRELLDVFTCIRNKTTLAEAGRLLERNSERRVKTPAEMARAVCRYSRGHCAHRRDLSDGSNSRLPISATAFRAIPCPMAKP